MRYVVLDTKLARDGVKLRERVSPNAVASVMLPVKARMVEVSADQAEVFAPHLTELLASGKIVPAASELARVEAAKDRKAKATKAPKAEPTPKAEAKP